MSWKRDHTNVLRKQSVDEAKWETVFSTPMVLAIFWISDGGYFMALHFIVIFPNLQYVTRMY